MGRLHCVQILTLEHSFILHLGTMQLSYQHKQQTNRIPHILFRKFTILYCTVLAEAHAAHWQQVGDTCKKRLKVSSMLKTTINK